MENFNKALVTGCGRGIGAAVARELSARSIELVALNRSREPLEGVIESLGDSAPISPYYIDVTDFEALDSLLGDICDAHPDIDLVILNAGLDRPQRIESFDWRIARQQIDTNLTANYVFAARLLPRLLERGAGRFAVVSSLGSYAGCPYEHAYNASKAGARMLIDGLRAELLHTPIGVTGIYPGFVATEMIAGNAFDSSSAIAVDEAGRLIVEGLARGQDEVTFPAEMGQLVSQVVAMPPRERAEVVRKLMSSEFNTA
ncbi:SDR family NAD(P)-dependent oxidoreductase [Parahaliea mediterranea]|uniref:SDR family NAD(P)-dependent oxidoreductase n=1 Tax=Parahaliea mediterranea TaxID=651086 RepID=A0A939DIW4_9GAMM|nr:SDR family NAD(P)-dependent oxidoreductase [Parahaliea mediterranea]MBN7798924.1 SDR family NAD(P)-dependent oxidoreductase [Parahaliea mediterranea]